MTGPDGRPGAALVVVNYASHDLLRANFAWTFGGAARVVVVDNHHSPAAAESITALATEAGWELVALPDNAGFGAGVNAGAARALALGCDPLLVVNPDVRLTAADVAALASAVAADPDALVSPLVVDATGRPWAQLGRVDLRGGRLFTDDTGDGPAWLSGACLGVSRRAWERLGGMDADYFMYWEDVDLSVRAGRAGLGLRLLPEVRVVHDVGGTQTAAAGKSRNYYYYNCRNRLVFAGKLLTGRQFLRWLLLTPADVRRVTTRGRPPSRWFRLRAALPPSLAGCAAGSWWALRNWRRGRRR